MHDIVTDLKDVWYDLNGILDYEDKREKDILDGFMSIINGFEEDLLKKRNITIPIGECDVELFESLVADSENTFTWTFETNDGEPIDLNFKKETEGDW